jgi:glycerol-3-phosphate dehydrogenase
LPGALDAHDRDWLLTELAAEFGAPQAERLWCIYGAAARDVARYASAERELAAELVDGGTHGEAAPLVAELVYSREKEWAETLADILQRRCMAGLRAGFGLDAAHSAAQWLRRLGIWDASRAAGELQAYRELARRQNVAISAT